jgi:predicted nucleic-acid-binding protein
MIGLDTNVLARYYIEDQGDDEARKQRLIARRIMESEQPLFIAKTVLLEFEWVMRGFYEFTRWQIVTVLDHLMALPHIRLEDGESIALALRHYKNGRDFADAVHLVSCRHCERIYSFDDRKFARKTAALSIEPAVVVPSDP